MKKPCFQPWMLALIATFFSAGSMASPRFAVDPSVDVAKLSSSGEIASTFKDLGSKSYSMDSSAVLKGVDFEKLYKASIDFNHYTDMDMPNLDECEIVDRSGSDILYTFTNMKTKVMAVAVTSKHFLEVRTHHALSSDTAGTEWQLTPGHSSWRHASEESSAFSRQDGSWFMKRLSDGSVYVRYFIYAQVNSSAPDWAVDKVAKSQFKDGVPRVIRALEASARRR